MNLTSLGITNGSCKFNGFSNGETNYQLAKKMEKLKRQFIVVFLTVIFGEDWARLKMT